MPVRHYPAIVEGDAESGYSVFFPDLPGCTSGGYTLQEAALNAEQGLSAHIALMLNAGEPVPSPSTLDDLPRPIEPDVVEVSRLLVRIDVRAKRPPEAHARRLTKA
jgi:predicted RNase H-like HicB family nuclease